MGKVVLNGRTTTALTRTTVHTGYEGRAFGMYVLSRFIPFAITAHQPFKRHVRGILVFGNAFHVDPRHEDYGVVAKKYKRVYTFNIRHYFTCYLPNVMGNNGDLTQPFTNNKCVYCGVAIADGDRRIIGETIKRRYRPDKYIWQSKKTLQSDSNGGDIFTPREGII